MVMTVADFFAANVWQCWGAVAILLLVAELLTSTFYVLCFSVGALAAMTASLMGGGLYAQLAAFAIFSLLSIMLVRPFVIKYLHKNRDGEERPSNADALIGRVGTVSQRIEAGGYGRVAIDGDDWKAETTDGSSVEVGEKVAVRDRESIILKVETV